AHGKFPHTASTFPGQGHQVCVGNWFQLIGEPFLVKIISGCLVIFRLYLLADFDLLFAIARIQIRYRGNKSFRVDMLRIVEYLISSAFLDKSATVHDTDTVAHMTYDSQIMADENIR